MRAAPRRGGASQRQGAQQLRCAAPAHAAAAPPAPARCLRRASRQRDVRYLAQRIAKKAAASAGGADKARPALSATSDFAAIMARRAPWYEAAAHVVIDGCDRDGDARPKEQLAAEVLRAFWARAEGGPGGPRGGSKGEVREQLAKAAAGLSALGGYLLP